jgi:hypothetical protein
MSPTLFLTLALRPGLALLPPAMDTVPAQALVLAICLQESGLVYRTQHPTGPARGFAQFEAAGGCAAVLAHPASKAHAFDLCTRLGVFPSAPAVHRALEYHDILTVTFARLLLWTLPDPLPDQTHVAAAWEQYLRAWRPGTPRPSTWRTHYVDAWALVQTDQPLPDCDGRVKERSQ